MSADKSVRSGIRLNTPSILAASTSSHVGFFAVQPARQPRYETVFDFHERLRHSGKPDKKQCNADLVLVPVYAWCQSPERQILEINLYLHGSSAWSLGPKYLAIFFLNFPKNENVIKRDVFRWTTTVMRNRVTSVILVMRKPAAFNADSWLTTRTRSFNHNFKFLIPYSLTASAQRSAAAWPRTGRFTRTTETGTTGSSQPNALPWRSVIVTIVLLKKHGYGHTVRDLFSYTLTCTNRCFLPLFKYPDYFLIGLRGPLRVRALILIRWPRTGRPTMT